MPRLSRKPQNLRLVDGDILFPENQLEIARWRKPREVHVQGDIFAPEVPFDFIHSCFWMMEIFPKHLFLLTTNHWQRWHDLSNVLPSCRHIIVKESKP